MDTASDIITKLEKIYPYNYRITDDEIHIIAQEAIEEIKKLRQLQQDIIAHYRVNMMRCCNGYSHQEFDNKIEEILNGDKTSRR